MNITVDISDFRRDLQKYFKTDYPESVARGFQALTQYARDAGRQRTAERYKLHSDFIPKGILNTPNTDSQVKAAAKSMERHHDLQAAVFLRPASDPGKGLGFMVPHETGAPKTPHGAMIAVPSYGISAYSFKTSGGAVKAKYKPAELLKVHNQKGDSKLPAGVIAGMAAEGNKPGKGGRRKGEAFIVTGKGGVPMVVRRKSGNRKPLEILYVFKKEVKSDGDWGFETTVQATVMNKYKSVLSAYVNK